MRFKYFVLLTFFLGVLGRIQAQLPIPQTNNSPLFQALTPEQSGITFLNRLQETDKVNYFKYEYLYNGGGVAVGDLNQDGLPDLYFTGNMVANRLYLNRGDLQFEDITAQASATYLNDWCTGVSMVDINADGLLDIYVCASGWYEGTEKDTRRNILFVNQGVGENGIPTFVDQAAQYGLDDPAYSTQASFFDYDRDGDLDMYLGNHPRIFREYVNDVIEKKTNPPVDTRDKLYRNDQGKFIDVSDQAGIVNYSHTLGLVNLDYNRDGWMDIYVSNDFQENDFLYENQGDGTFVNVINKSTRHTSKFSMGVDANDFDNDGWTDILTVEMMAADNKRQKTNMAPMNPTLFWSTVEAGFGYQYMHNALQLNRGNGRFSEISYLSGVATTDWSWAPLFADFDNDGFKDIFISNGFRRDVLDKDFSKKLKEKLKEGNTLYQDLEASIPRSQQVNYLFRNQGDLTFEHRTDWGLTEKVNTNGAAYVDLDLDGDLDLVLNHMEETSLVYRNRSRENGGGNFLQIELQGPPENSQGMGTVVLLRTKNDEVQLQQASPVRGFQSSVDPVLHFGLGTKGQVSEIEITWPDQKKQVLREVKANQRLKVNYGEAVQMQTQIQDTPSSPLLGLASASFFPAVTHQENEYDDYQKQVLLPHKLSQLGPFGSVADVNGDGWEDAYLGGSAAYPGQLLIQEAKGFRLQKVPVFELDRPFEDQQSCWFDADGDGDMDLYVVSGSYELEENDPLMQDRFYRNEGKGQFVSLKDVLPERLQNGSCVVAGDFDGDGDPDLFVGGGVVPGKYPLAAPSQMLRNDGGRFTNVSSQWLAEAGKLGLVKSAVWTDYDQDGKMDLIVAGEWTPITFFRNEGERFTDQTASLGLSLSNGWWNCIETVDLDLDGDLDFVLGNLGLNSKFQASPEYPFQVYADDLDNSGTFDIVLGYYENGAQYPVRGLQCSSEQVPGLADKIETYDLFGSLELGEIYGEEKLQQSLQLDAYEFRSVWLENKKGQMILHPLPHIAQIAPTNGIAAHDWDNDGCPDLVLVGNQYPVEVETGRYDAHQGLVLLGDCKGNFAALTSQESGLRLDGDMRSVQSLKTSPNGSRGLIIGINQADFQLYQKR